MDMTVLSAKVGQSSAPVGGYESLRMDPQRNLAVVQGHGRFRDAVLRGRCFGVCNQAGVTSQNGLSATTPVLTLYNPAGSGVNLEVWYAGATFAVAFGAAAAVWAAVGTNVAAAAVTGTLTTSHRNMLLGSSAAMSAIPYLAATLPAAPVGLCLLGMGLTGAITTAPLVQTLERWFDGALVLKPGTNLSIQTSTASGTNSTFCEFIWEEVDE